MKRYTYFGVALLIVAVLVMGLFAVGMGQASRTRMGWVLMDRLTVLNGGATITSNGLTVTDGGVTVTSGGAEVTSGGLTVTAGGATITDGGLTVTAGGVTLSDGDLIVADDLNIVPQTSITVTQDMTITPTGSYQPITAAGNLGTAAIAAGSAGDVLYMINTSNTTVTLTDTGTLLLSDNAALAQYDNILLISDGTNWIEVAQANN